MKTFTLKSALHAFFSPAIIIDCKKTALSQTTVNIVSASLSNLPGKLFRIYAFIASTPRIIIQSLRNCVDGPMTNIVLRQDDDTKQGDTHFT